MVISSGVKNHRVLVTAASKGIGFAAARAFLQEGARVVISSSNPENLEKARGELARFGEVHAVAGDLSRKESLEAIVAGAVSKLGGIDTLVYVTGSPKPGRFLELSYEEWRSASDLLVVSPAYLAKLVADHMTKEKIQGRMVFLSSWVIKEPNLSIALSSVCRSSILGLVRTLARELGPKGIRVNGIMPGNIRTGRTDQLALDASKRTGITPEDYIKGIERDIPLGRIGSPEELARVIVFLGSEMSSFVSGANFAVDGAQMRSISG
jgi:3-oxoacyl-[acyl-carrier protein] reductase